MSEQQPPNICQSIAQIRQKTHKSQCIARAFVQIKSLTCKQTRTGNPYWEAVLADGEGEFALPIWSDHPAFSLCEAWREGHFLEIHGTFKQHPQYGLTVSDWGQRDLSEAEIATFLQGPADVRERQKQDYHFIVNTLESIEDPRLKALGALFMVEFGARFSRTAAARAYHHARRGGLVEHIAQMMRSALSICEVYPSLHRDLLICGVLFHDAGKLWETCYGKNDFSIQYSQLGELLGHITIGVEVVNQLWQKLKTRPEWRGWQSIQPGSEDVRLHLLHLIASHHGTKEFGSPIEPKTPEAIALHHIDNIDAKLEMLKRVYQTAPVLAPEIFKRTPPFTTNLVRALSKMEDSQEAAPLEAERLQGNAEMESWEEFEEQGG